MKKIVKILLSLMLIVSFNSCTSEDNVVDDVLQIQFGAVLRTIEVLSSSLNSSDPSSPWGVTVEEQDHQDGGLLQSVDLQVSIRDLTTDNGFTNPSAAIIKSFAASEFSTGPQGLPRITIETTFAESVAAMGITSADFSPGDIFQYDLILNLTDGRVFNAANAGGIITGGFFASPFKYNALISCAPQDGVYVVEMHDSFGDGWQMTGNGGPGIEVDVDGTILAVGMCSPYGGSAIGTFLENGAGTGCTTWPASVTDPTSEWFDATGSITIPVGAQSALWSFPGDSFGEISFEVFAPDGTLLFASGAPGEQGPGVLPILLCL